MKDFQKEYGNSDLLDTLLNEAVAETLCSLREKKGWSYSELANKMNNVCSRQTLNNYELGKSKLRMNMFYEFAKVYNLSGKELYELINNNYFKKIDKNIKKFDN